MELIGKQKKILIVVAIAIIAVVVIVFILAERNGAKNPNTTNGGSANSGTASSAPITRLPVPADVVVPEVGTATTSDIAVPQVEAAAAPGVGAKYRSFNIIVQNNGFAPSTIAVNLGDTVNLQVGAVDGNYDFTQPDFGFHVALPEGQDKQIQFAATAKGEFVFYCSVCGGPAKGPVGYLIVK
jgi:heme/copper-type cytochrome/quinol oxidase subunit 2